MNPRLVALAVAWLLPAVAFAQHFHQHFEAAPDNEDRKSVCDVKRFAQAQPDDGIRKVKWTVKTTGGDDALRFFQQGVTLLYGFNYEDALRNFERAISFDDTFAMAYWGKAMAAAPNINLAQDNLCGEKAREWSLAAQKYASQQTKPSLEAEITDALVARYTGNSEDRVQAVEYAVAMRGVWGRWQKDPAAPHVAAVFAEALLNLRPWALYDNDQREAIGTSEVLNVLWSVLGSSDAIGANHLWVHTVEASPKPESAKESADLLFGAVPSSGHLLHMPSHIYLLMGDYAKAAEANKNAIAVDRRQFGEACAGKDPYNPTKKYKDYITDSKCLPLYYGHYLAHNLYFRAVANAFLGRFKGPEGDPEAGADFAARMTRVHVERFVANEPGLQRYMAAWLMLMAADGNWPAILGAEEPLGPPKECYSDPFPSTGCHILRSMWHWAKGMAYTSTEKPPPDLVAARKRLQDFRHERDLISQSGPTGWGNNSATAVLAIAEEVLRARIAWAGNRRNDAIEHLQLAVSHEDNLAYDEPPQWMYPVRQSLGGAYLALGGKDNYTNAKRAFCADLERHPKNGRSLYGLARALEELKDPRAPAARTEFENLWRQSADDAHKKFEDRWLWLHGMPAGPQAEAADETEGAGHPMPALGAAPEPGCADLQVLASPG